jgi:hypothetical protein
MKFYRKVLVVIIILVFMHIIWNAWKKYVYKGVLFEGFSSEPDPVATKEVLTIMNSTPTLIQPIPDRVADQPLREYIIKASANSAISGRYASTEMIKYVLSRGCRFLDFEVFLMKDDNAKPTVIVSSSSDPSFKVIDTDKNMALSLDDALAATIDNAFAPSLSGKNNIPSPPNPRDPLFIQLRVKSNDPSIYKLIAKSVDHHLKGTLYDGKIDNKTVLSKLMGKTVLVIDKTLNRNYADLAKCGDNDKNCYDLSKYVTIESGSENLYTQKYGDLMNQEYVPINILDKCIRCTDVKYMRVIMPDSISGTPQNPDMKTLQRFYTNYASQIVAYRFNLLDDGITKYEKFFDDNKSAFVPLAYAISYFKKLDP